MEKKPVGRPKKVGAKKPGELNPGECYFSFIADRKTVAVIKKVAKRRKIRIKDLMASILTDYSPEKRKQVLTKAEIRNEFRYIAYEALKQKSPTD